MDTVTTISIEVENMSEDLKTVFVEFIDLVMMLNGLTFTKNVKVETVDKIVADTKAFAEAENGR